MERLMADKPEYPDGEDQLSVFLDKIHGESDQQVSRIEAETEQQCTGLLRDAHQGGRRYFHEAADKARNGQELESQRQLSRVRARLRRERWQVLREIQADAMSGVEQALHASWQQPERQWAWCEYWLKRALAMAGDQALHVTLGQDGLPETGKRLKRLLKQHPAGGDFTLDADTQAGLLIEWGDELLDGRLLAQQPFLQDAIFHELTDWLHADPGQRDKS
jgi:hypothetical protein